LQTQELYAALEEQYFGDKMHERDEIDALPHLLEGVSIFVDVGASLGQYTFFANQILKNSTIYCIEPDPIRVRRLRELTLKWEEASSNKIVVIQAAAAETAGQVEFFRTDSNISGGLFMHQPSDHQLDWAMINVDSVSLDSLFRDLNPDLIKIDVEGAEYRVLAGARDILRAGHCQFLVEVHPWGDKSLNKTPSDIFKFFDMFGYDFKRTHRHWLFRKSGSRIARFVKRNLILLILQNSWLKVAAKTCTSGVTGLIRKTKLHSSRPPSGISDTLS